MSHLLLVFMPQIERDVDVAMSILVCLFPAIFVQLSITPCSTLVFHIHQASAPVICHAHHF
jgi:hypothetical protein